MRNFEKYWVAGLIFAIITGSINTLTSLIGRYQPDTKLTWNIISGIIAITLLIIIPWIYGRLIEVIYLKIIK